MFVFTVAFSCGVGIRSAYRQPVTAYYDASEMMFLIPDIFKSYVPQGMYYCEDEQVFLLTGYDSKGNPSPVYVVDRAGDLLGKVTLQYADGSPYYGHCGGIACYGDFVYLTGDDARLYVLSLSEILEAEKGGAVRIKGEVCLQSSEQDYITPAFVTVYQNKLVVGEFYTEYDYPTLPSHHITSKAGDTHYALALEFALDPNAAWGMDPVPQKAYSLPQQVQGMCYDGDRVYLSCSWWLDPSLILEYDVTRIEEQGTIEVLGKTVPLYALDSSSLVEDYTVMQMAEGIVMLDGKLYLLSEFACGKYMIGRLTSSYWCYATDLDQLK